MMEARVLNVKWDGEMFPTPAIYIGRKSKWGNPFIIGRDGTRSQVIEKFRREVLPDLDLSELRGKHLVCHCAPLPCHGDVILWALGKNNRVNPDPAWLKTLMDKDIPF